MCTWSVSTVYSVTLNLPELIPVRHGHPRPPEGPRPRRGAAASQMSDHRAPGRGWAIRGPTRRMHCLSRAITWTYQQAPAAPCSGAAAPTCSHFRTAQYHHHKDERTLMSLVHKIYRTAHGGGEASCTRLPFFLPISLPISLRATYCRAASFYLSSTPHHWCGAALTRSHARHILSTESLNLKKTTVIL